MARPRSSRARRKQPVRRPIPANRLSQRSTASKPADGGSHDLADGWPADGAVRIRPARRSDIPTVRALSTLAGVDLDAEVVEAIDNGIAGAALRAGFTSDQHAFVEHLAEQVYVNQRGSQARTVEHAVLVLVAEHEQHGVIGTVVAYPPTNVIDRLIDVVRASGGGGKQLMQLFCSGIMSLARIAVIAVAESQRGRGIGGSLLRRCWQVYERCGYMLIFGQSEDAAGLQRFFHRHGFEFLAPGAGFDPWVIFGVHADVRPEIGARTFIWRRRENRRGTLPRRAARDETPDPDTRRPPHQPAAAPPPPSRRLPLVNAGAVHLLLAVHEDPSTAPVKLLAAAAWQASWHTTGNARAQLDYCVAAGLRHLGFPARVIPAQVTAWREDQPQRSAQTIGADLDAPGGRGAAIQRHTVVWSEPFALLLDLAVFRDAAVRALADDGLHDLLALPPMLPLPDIRPFTTSATAPTVQRGPITIAWHLGRDAADSHDERGDQTPAIQRGARTLADATLDLLLATASYADLEPMHTRFPHLRALMADRENALWSPAAA